MRNGPAHPAWPAGSYSSTNLPQPMSARDAAADGVLRGGPGVLRAGEPTGLAGPLTTAAIAVARGASLRGAGSSANRTSGRRAPRSATPSARPAAARRNRSSAPGLTDLVMAVGGDTAARACDGAGRSGNLALRGGHGSGGRSRYLPDQQSRSAAGADPLGARPAGLVRAARVARVQVLECPDAAAVGTGGCQQVRLHHLRPSSHPPAARPGSGAPGWLSLDAGTARRRLCGYRPACRPGPRAGTASARDQRLHHARYPAVSLVMIRSIPSLASLRQLAGSSGTPDPLEV